MTDEKVEIREKSESFDIAWVHEELAQVQIRVLSGHKAGVNICTFFNNDNSVLTASDDHSVVIWDLNRGSVSSQLKVHQDIVSGATVSGDNARILSCGWDKKVIHSDVETGSVLCNFDATHIVTCCSFSSDGKLALAATDYDNNVHIYDLTSGTEIHVLKAIHEKTITSCRFTSNGERIMTTSMDWKAKMYDLKSEKATITLKEYHTNVISDCCFTEEERRLATSSWDRTIKIWDVSTGAFRTGGPVTLAKAHQGSVSSCAISADGQHLVSGGYDCAVVVWDVENAIQRLLLRGHTDWVEDVAISTNKRWIASASKDGTVRLWDISQIDKIPFVQEKQEEAGLKVANCTRCGKPFSKATMEDRDESLCVFCRLEQEPVDPSAFLDEISDVDEDEGLEEDTDEQLQ